MIAAMKATSFQQAEEQTIQYQSNDLAGIRAEMKQYVANAAAVVTNLPGAGGHKRWILDMAHEVADQDRFEIFLSCIARFARGTRDYPSTSLGARYIAITFSTGISPCR